VHETGEFSAAEPDPQLKGEKAAWRRGLSSYQSRSRTAMLSRGGWILHFAFDREN